MPPASRRAVLVALATLPVAGCLGDAGTGTDSDTSTTVTPGTDGTSTTPSPTPGEPVRLEPGDTFEADDITVTVSDLAVNHGMVKFGTTHPDPIWEEGAQFLRATVTVEGGADPADLPITATTDTMSGNSDRYYGFAPDAPAGVQPFGFLVPTDPAPTEAAIVWDGPREVRWQVPDALVTELGVAPDFSLKQFEVPDSAGEGEHMTVTLGIANDGDRDGEFLAELGNAAISDQPEIRVDVPAGESRTVERTVEATFFEGDMDVVLRWEGGTERKTVSKA